MEFPIFADKDETRFCYMRLRVLQELVQQTGVLDALIKQLEVPGKKAAFKNLSPSEKATAIYDQIDHYRRTKTSLWYGIDGPEVLAASIYRAYDYISDRVVESALGAVKRESDLLLPVSNWLRQKGLKAYMEVPLATKRIDVVGYRKGGLISSERIIGVELKNDLAQMERGLDQMTTFSEFAHSIYLACTPALAAEYLDKRACAPNVKHWDPTCLERKLANFGFGLLLVEKDKVYEVRRPKERELNARFLADAREAISTAKSIGGD